ncbi:MAG TPA: hypothetical protein VGM07_21910 [Stellaceae bacterium]|jgi:hypothetical protein
MRAPPALLAVLLAVAQLAGCTVFDPYPATPQPAIAGAKDAGPRVAICYDFAVSSTAEVQQAAQQQCAPDTRAARIATDWKLDFCPLLLPARATFVCAPSK